MGSDQQSLSGASEPTWGEGGGGGGGGGWLMLLAHLKLLELEKSPQGKLSQYYVAFKFFWFCGFSVETHQF